MGFAYAGLDKFEEAIEAYEKAIEINPDNYETYKRVKTSLKKDAILILAKQLRNY
jgi:tetratricopeptide (TPR) repeat protein